MKERTPSWVSSDRHCRHTPAAAGRLLQVLHDQVLLNEVVRPLGGRVPVQAVERDGLQRGLCVIGGQHGVPLKPVRVGLPPLAVRRTQAELEHSLKSSAEILVKETVNNRVDAAVEEGQPVGKGVDVNVDDSVLLLGQPGIVAQHHQGPQRQPGKDEEQSHN